MVRPTPSVRALSSACLTRCGCSIALVTRFFWADSTDDRSVPALINDVAVRTSTWPAWTTGAGTSNTLTAPVFAFCKTCFIGYWLVRIWLRLSSILIYSVNHCPLSLWEREQKGFE